MNASKIGIVGTGYIASKFIEDTAAYCKHANISAVYNPNSESAEKFAKRYGIEGAFGEWDEFLDVVDVVYIASPHEFHFDQALSCIKADVAVLCEKPMAATRDEIRMLQNSAENRGVYLAEAIKCAFAPGFKQLVDVALSGAIGEIVSVDASFTKLISDPDCWELAPGPYGGSMCALASYPLYAIAKIMGTDARSVTFNSVCKDGIDVFTRGTIGYAGRSASFKVGFGAKSEADLIVSGTKGYLYVPSPWWKTFSFEIRYEDPSRRDAFTSNFQGYGLHYELQAMLASLEVGNRESPEITLDESCFIARVLEEFRCNANSFERSFDSYVELEAR